MIEECEICGDRAHFLVKMALEIESIRGEELAGDLPIEEQNLMDTKTCETCLTEVGRAGAQRGVERSEGL